MELLTAPAHAQTLSTCKLRGVRYFVAYPDQSGSCARMNVRFFALLSTAICSFSVF